MASYQEMLNSAFSAYYARFRELGALSKETAVTMEEIFPDGGSLTDKDKMHKMLSMAIVKRSGMNRYWLDEKRAADGNAVLRQRIILIVIAVVAGVTIGLLKRNGVI